MKEHKINMSRFPLEMRSFRVAKIREAVGFAQTDGKINLWAKLCKNIKFKGLYIRSELFVMLYWLFFTIDQELYGNWWDILYKLDIFLRR